MLGTLSLAMDEGVDALCNSSTRRSKENKLSLSSCGTVHLFMQVECPYSLGTAAVVGLNVECSEPKKLHDLSIHRSLDAAE